MRIADPSTASKPMAEARRELRLRFEILSKSRIKVLYVI